jgi:hypothetical protein
MYGLVEGLTPIIKSLGDTDWIRGGYSVETKESVSMTDSITSSMLGPMYKISQKIAKHLEDNPTYVWFLDNVNARVRGKKDIHYMLWNFIKDSPCSYYWLRGRVVAMEGSKVGYSDSPSKLLLGIKITKTITDMAPSTQTYWVNGETAVILRDGAAVQHAANTKNLAKMIFFNLDKYPLMTEAKLAALGNDKDQKMLDALLGGTFNSGDTKEPGPKTKKEIYKQPNFDTTGGDDGTGGDDSTGGDDGTVGDDDTGGDDGTGGTGGADGTGGTGGDKYPFQQIKKDEVEPVPPDTVDNVTDTLGFDQIRRRLPTMMLQGLAHVADQGKQTFDTPPPKKKRMPTISPSFLNTKKTKTRYTEFRPTRITFEEHEPEKPDYLPHICVVGGLLILFYFQN